MLHLPHDSVEIPAEVRGQFLLDDGELAAELTRMTDHRTLELFAGQEASTSAAAIVRATVSRLAVDVERFEDDQFEAMATRGMGAIYTVKSDLKPLRRSLNAGEREALMAAYYRPHHAQLEAAVSAALEGHARCLVIDCHSFPSVALPYELADPRASRPDICIGSDEFHTGPALADAFVAAFQGEGWSVSLNTPFAGALVPASRDRKDPRVSAVMVEVNRRLYLREQDAAPLASFADIGNRVRRCCQDALATSGL